MKLVKIQIFSPWPGSNFVGTTSFRGFVVVVAVTEDVDACRALAAREMLTDSRPSCSVIDRSGLIFMATGLDVSGGAKLCRRTSPAFRNHRRSSLALFAHGVRAECNAKLGKSF